MDYTRHIQVLSDPATFFALLPERNNRELIRKMVTSTRIGVPDEYDPTLLRRYRGQKVAFSNGWAKEVKWCLPKNRYPVLNACGKMTHDSITYSYCCFCFDESRDTYCGNTIVFKINGKVIEHERCRCNKLTSFEIMAMLAPPGVILTRLAKKTARREQYRLAHPDYITIVTRGCKYPGKYKGNRTNHSNGWAKELSLSTYGENLMSIELVSSIIVENRITYKYKGIRYVTDYDGLRGEMTFDLDGKIIISKHKSLCNDGFEFTNSELFEFVRPRN